MRPQTYEITIVGQAGVTLPVVQPRLPGACSAAYFHPSQGDERQAPEERG